MVYHYCELPKSIASTPFFDDDEYPCASVKLQVIQGASAPY